MPTLRLILSLLTVFALPLWLAAEPSEEGATSPEAEAAVESGSAEVGEKKGDAEAAEPELTATLKKLKAYLAGEDASLEALAEQAFAAEGLSEDETERARQMIWDWRLAKLRGERKAEFDEGVIRMGDLSMPFAYRVFGDKPEDGRSLYISLHGGGSTAKRVNDQQWRNQIRLYEPQEGVYVAPRAPTDAWNMWFQPHMDAFYQRLIEDMVALMDVNPAKVYIMGYSAGGDGVYQVAPRMADRWAAAAMMAGHPNETKAEGLRNLPFILQMGEHDRPYDRNKKAAEWEEWLARLHKEDPEGYPHKVVIHKGKGHWMDREDRLALQWMAPHRRNAVPEKVVWVQDDVTHDRFYWVAVPEGEAQERAVVTAEQRGQWIQLKSDDVEKLIVHLDDRLLDLDKPVHIKVGDEEVFSGKVTRTIANLARTLADKGDPDLAFPARVEVGL